ncbi:hypothetical protein [Alicyclobacillus dauci]|uniref:Uncharacterized protein n=1 Tax=Alicyclobacillus dauci TaxID=1475485 RepID=A0ABY6Z7Z2_9BACL|nr:hypothetical protein [Alicyclobacillus dauci]WAH38818.1 hypothetical protein NZD86_10230 [Alicyclobacillus dauci]
MKQVGHPLLWCLIPIGIFSSFFGMIAGARAIEQSTDYSANKFGRRQSRNGSR